jgi:uncharacterized protein (TIGR04255 family)
MCQPRRLISVTKHASPLVENPLRGDSPAEIPLPNAPLVRVVAQVRFSDILNIKKEEFIADFQEGVRHDYPTLNREESSSITWASGGGPPAVKQDAVWRLTDVTGNWRLSLTHNFVALETQRYESRDDFLDRLRVAVEAVYVSFKPSLARRIGVRYVDRVTGSAFDRIAELVKEEMLGVVKSTFHSEIEHVMTEARCRTLEGQMTIRWGMLPAGKTHDTSLVDPTDQNSWILDLDGFQDLTKDPVGFEVEPIVERSRQLANRAYTFFRWSVTDEFLREFGGKL